MRQSSKGSEYPREREFKVILEDIHSQFKVFGEGMNDIRNCLGRVENRLDHVESEVTQMKFEMGILKSDVGTLKSDVGTLRSEMREMKLEMGHFRRVLPTLATKDDLLALERRLIRLETPR